MDLIKREDAIKALTEVLFDEPPYLNSIEKCEAFARKTLENVPSAEPWDIYNFDEWCTDCKEYDTENHRCPRWNKVIRRTLEENQSKQGEWIPCSERLPSKGVPVLVNGIMEDAPPITISTDASLYYENGWINAWMPLPPVWEGADDEGVR